MRHRHLGPKVKYITRRNNIRYRKRPTHSQSLIRRNRQFRRPVRRFIRLADPGYAKKYLNKNTDDIESEAKAFVLPGDPEDIYINIIKIEDPDEVAKIIDHEELHNILQKEIDVSASLGLDVITVPRFFDDDGKLLNPETAGGIARTGDEAVELAAEEIGIELDAKRILARDIQALREAEEAER